MRAAVVWISTRVSTYALTAQPRLGLCTVMGIDSRLVMGQLRLPSALICSSGPIDRQLVQCHVFRPLCCGGIPLFDVAHCTILLLRNLDSTSTEYRGPINDGMEYSTRWDFRHDAVSLYSDIRLNLLDSAGTTVDAYQHRESRSFDRWLLMAILGWCCSGLLVSSSLFTSAVGSMEVGSTYSYHLLLVFGSCCHDPCRLHVWNPLLKGTEKLASMVRIEKYARNES